MDCVDKETLALLDYLRLLLVHMLTTISSSKHVTKPTIASGRRSFFFLE